MSFSKLLLCSVLIRLLKCKYKKIFPGSLSYLAHRFSRECYAVVSMEDNNLSPILLTVDTLKIIPSISLYCSTILEIEVCDMAVEAEHSHQ